MSEALHQVIVDKAYLVRGVQTKKAWTPEAKTRLLIKNPARLYWLPLQPGLALAARSYLGGS